MTDNSWTVREDAEDITQDVFVKVAGKLEGFAGKAAFRTWLYRITKRNGVRS